MTDQKYDFETLNAFVDNELDADQRAEVLAQAARDPALARELAALSRLKATLAQSIDTPELDLPATAAPRRWRRVAMAASVALIVAAGAVFGLARLSGDTALDPAWALSAHASWAERPGSPGGVGRALAAAAAPGLYLPDLSAAKLSIAHVGHAEGPAGGRATVVGYVGTRGCKVSLIIFPAAETAATPMERIDRAPLLGYAWRVGRHGYAVVAEGMPEARLSLVAAGIREASLKRRPVGDDTRTALAESRAKSPPCRA